MWANFMSKIYLYFEKESDMGIEKLFGRFLNRNVTDEDLGNAKFDRELTKQYAGKHRGSVRISTGRFYTEEEWQQRRKQLLKVKLPG
jgi:hypothetical protein